MARHAGYAEWKREHDRGKYRERYHSDPEFAERERARRRVENMTPDDRLRKDIRNTLNHSHARVARGEAKLAAAGMRVLADRAERDARPVEPVPESTLFRVRKRTPLRSR